MNSDLYENSKVTDEITAISGTVFLKRDQKRSSHLGIDISEKAQTQNMNATVVAADCDFLEKGDRVHVPHFGVMDMEYDSETYAVCKAERIFAVERDGEWKPVNGYVKVLKCQEDHIRDEDGEIALYMTDNHIETTNWVEMVDAPDESLLKKYIGLFTPAPENDPRLARIGYSDFFCMHEGLIEFFTTG